jgi:hypothetical protein
MEDTLTKLRPDRDLQCYFFEPSAIAALSAATPNALTLSGCWRQQFDWAVVEWNRDNVFEHPALRNLPDGDLSGLHLSYQETRTNCIPMDSALYPNIDWPYLRVWAESDGEEQIYKIPLLNYARPLSGYLPASATFQLQGSITGGDYIELAWMDQHFNYQVGASDTIETAAAALANIITGNSATGLMTATSSGSAILLTYMGMPGANGNRIGAYGTVHGAGTEVWTPTAAVFSGGTSPAAWQIDLDFGNLADSTGAKVPTDRVRKLRWTWAADLTVGSFQRCEFSVAISNWTVTGTDFRYSVPGPGSRRVKDTDVGLNYAGQWTHERGNYSGGSVHCTTGPTSAIAYSYTNATAHTVYLGTRYLENGATIHVKVDASAPMTFELSKPGEDVLVRLPLASFTDGAAHEIVITHAGATGTSFYFDFLELAVPTTALPTFKADSHTTLATDWDTAHSQVLAPERTAWLINKLGFQGRANHYAGCLWFYELSCPGQSYAAGSVVFSGKPQFGKTTTVLLDSTEIVHVNLIGDTAESIAKCFELLINAGVTGVWARADGSTLHLTARTMGTAGNAIHIDAVTNGTQFSAQIGSSYLSGGVDGKWLTDLAAEPRINRAARDWSSGFFRAMKEYGIPVAVSFSMELGSGDDSAAASIAQRYPSGSPVWLNTPSLQTNFGPQSTAFWSQVYLDMAGLMSAAGLPVYLQFGETQWWYFCPPTNPAGGDWSPMKNGGMPFYDTYTTSTFQTRFGTAMHVFTDPADDPTPYPNERTFLPELIGTFTKSIMNAVRSVYPTARFEVLYPPDVNNAALTQVVNLPGKEWAPSDLSCLKTENFTYTGNRDLNAARDSVELPATLGFPPSQSSHLIGIGDYTTPWLKEWRIAVAAGLESVVLFALDQFCLIGYSLPLEPGTGRSAYMGG